MADSEFVNTVRDALGSRGLGKLFTPVCTPANAAEVVFSGFGVANAGAPFLTGWRIDMDANSDARNIQAFSAGTVYYVPAPLSGLVLQNADVFGDLVRRDTLPDWFPRPEYVIYKDVDAVSVERRMKDYLSRNPKIAALLHRQAPGLIGTLEQAFMRGLAGLPAVPVPAGEILGEALPSSPGRRTVQISMQRILGNIEGLFLDPASFHLHWRAFFSDLEGHALRDAFIRPFAGPIATGIVRYVAKNGGNRAPYLMVVDAAHSIRDAVAAANYYDTVVIVDTETYDEGAEIDIAKPMTLTSLRSDDVKATDHPAFPRLDGNEDHRVVRVHNEFRPGLVTLANLEITRGLTADFSGASTEPARAGAGISIEFADATYIRNCFVHHNRGGYGRNKHGYGGGIFTESSSAYLYRNRITDNRTVEPGAGIGVWGRGWPTIEGNLILRNTAVVHLESRPDGGGIAIEINNQPGLSLLNVSDPRAWDQNVIRQAKSNQVRIIDNEIANNSAADDGGGLYLSVLSRAYLRNNNIHDNVAANAGGGIRASMASELDLNGDTVRGNRTNTDHGKLGGGGIASRNSNVRLTDVIIEGNRVEGWAGGGVFFVTIGVDVYVFDRIIREAFGATMFSLEIIGGAITDNHAEQFPGQVDDLGQVVDRRKGAGVYVVRALPGETDTVIPIPYPAGLPFLVSISPLTAIAGNHLDPSPNVPPTPIEAPNSVEFHVEDQINRLGNPIDDANKAGFLTGTAFYYQSP